MSEDREDRILERLDEYEERTEARHREMRDHLFGDGKQVPGIFLRLDRVELWVKVAGAAIATVAGSFITAIFTGWRHQ